MGRFRGGVIAVALLLGAAPARGADISHVASSGEPGNPFDIDFSIRWDRTQERATITRERPDAAGTGVVEGDRLRYSETRNAIVPRVAIGLWNDLELHFEIPYVLGDDHAWRYGTHYGQPTGPAGSTIAENQIDANGQQCVDGSSNPITCPIFQVGARETTIYHGGRAGDFKAGLAWGIFNDRKDVTKPYWLVGVDITFPTSALYEPAKDRTYPGTGFVTQSPNNQPAKPAPFGEKIWKWDLYTVLSRRMGVFDPYVKAHVTAMAKSASTYSNCDFADELAAAPVRQMNSLAPASCKTWGSDADAKLPWVAGASLGGEIVPYENAAEQQRVAIDVRLFTDYTSSQRFYNELTDASGKLHMTEGYLTMGGLFGLYLRASENVSLKATAALSTRTSHYLSGESLGKDGKTPALNPNSGPGAGTTTDPAAMNPNYDWRYDAPGNRFRISEVSVFELSFAGVVSF